MRYETANNNVPRPPVGLAKVSPFRAVAKRGPATGRKVKSQQPSRRKEFDLMSTTAVPADQASQPLLARRASWRQSCVAALTIAVSGVVVYANSFQKPFVYDGIHFILENRAIHSLRFWNYGEGANRPIGFLSFAVNYALGGTEVWGYHAASLAIHVAAAWVLYALCRDTLSSERLAKRYGE